ncbi:MAG: DUF465 domain-containing protein [Candidatus Acidiferrales bacterium]
MAATAQDYRQSLISSDAELQRLAQEHSRCEEKLEELRTQSYLSSEDLIQEITLKKRKLHIKDQMELMIARRRQSA